MRKPAEVRTEVWRIHARHRPRRPPDLPPALLEWQLIEGGKGDMLPGEPKAPSRRRRVGEGDDV